MGSGAQAQLAASQAATEAQAEAARNALAFSKEQFEWMKGARRPYMDAGAGASQMLMNLLGLTPGLVHNPVPGPPNPPRPGDPGDGGGGNGGGGNGGGGNGGGGGGNGGGGGGNGGGGGGRGGGGGGAGGGGAGGGPGGGDPGQKFPGYVPPPFKGPADAGKEKYPYYSHLPPIGGDPNPDFKPGDPPNPDDVWLYPPGSHLNINPDYLAGGPSGGAKPKDMGMATVFDPDTGAPMDVPSSLVSFYQAKGFKV